MDLGNIVVDTFAVVVGTEENLAMKKDMDYNNYFVLVLDLNFCLDK